MSPGERQRRNNEVREVKGDPTSEVHVGGACVKRTLRRCAGKLVRFLLPDTWVCILRGLVLHGREYAEHLTRTESSMRRGDTKAGRDSGYWAEMLRMYAHIVDKGIQSCGYTPGHSGNAYRLAKEALRQVAHSPHEDDPSVAWARVRILEHEKLQSGETPMRQPFSAITDAEAYDNLMRLMLARRSIRAYQERPIDVGSLRKVLAPINLAPCSCNRQTTKAFVTLSPDLARACMVTCKGATGFSEYVPCFVSFCADLRPYSLPREMALPMVDVSLGVQNCCLVAHSLNLSLALLSWCGRDERDEEELRRLLQIPDYCEIVVNGLLGYPQYDVVAPVKKPLDLTVVQRKPGQITQPEEGKRL